MLLLLMVIMMCTYLLHYEVVTSFFPDYFLPNCFRFVVLYTVYSSGLAVLYLNHSK